MTVPDTSSINRKGLVPNGGWLYTKMFYRPQTETHPSSNQTWQTNALALHQTNHPTGYTKHGQAAVAYT